MRVRALFLATLLLAACGSEPVQEEGPPPLYKYTSMKNAVAEGQATLPAFWDAYHSGNPAYSDFALNIVTPSPRYSEEHVWLVDIRPSGEAAYSGRIPEQDEIEDGLAPGEIITFGAGQIADWRYKEDGKYRGAYTSRAMLGLAPTANLDNIKAMFHDSPLP